MTDLVAFLRARLDEDEAEARETADADAEFWSDVKGDGTYFDRFGPARVLREVEAKRVIIAECEPRARAGIGAARMAAQRTLRILATVYRGHPDYRPEWKP